MNELELKEDLLGCRTCQDFMNFKLKWQKYQYTIHVEYKDKIKPILCTIYRHDHNEADIGDGDEYLDTLENKTLTFKDYLTEKKIMLGFCDIAYYPTEFLIGIDSGYVYFKEEMLDYIYYAAKSITSFLAGEINK